MSRPPNILFIVTDHHAHVHHATSHYPIPQPHREKFLSEAVDFSRAYSVCPLCTPARCSMMSGQYPSRHGLLWNTDGAGRQHEFREGTRLFSHYLSEAGYRMGYVGKWHCGKDKLPADYGMPGWSLGDYGRPYESPEYQTYAAQRGFGPARAHIENWINRPQEAGREHTLHNPSPWYYMNASGIHAEPPEAHQDYFVAHLSCERLKELTSQKQPWAMVASFWGPHQPYFPSQPFAGRIDPKSIPPYPTFDDDLRTRPSRHWFHRDMVHRGPRSVWPAWSDWQPVVARAYEQQMQVDDAIGRVLDTLEASGQTEDTLVIWCADHGDALASHGGVWDKSSTYTEEVGRVPLAIRWPKGFGGGATCRAPVSNLDVTATMLDAAGLAIPPQMQSRSLLTACRDPQDEDVRDHVVCEHHGHGLQIFQRIVVTPRYKYVAALLDGDELYDLQDDPYELRNLARDPGHAGVKRGLQARLLEHIRTQEDGSARQLAHWVECDLSFVACVP